VYKRQGESNTTQSIRELKAINGTSISDLEIRLRPGKDSTSGFLGAQEPLLAVLANDNDLVCGKLKLSHQALAAPMEKAREAFVLHGAESTVEISIEGRRYSVSGNAYRGYQNSPFNDGTRSSMDITVKNLENGESISFSGLLPDLIARYGFYEGRLVPYRVEPAQIVKVFDFLNEKSLKKAATESVKAPKAVPHPELLVPKASTYQGPSVEMLLAEDYAVGFGIAFRRTNGSKDLVSGKITEMTRTTITVQTSKGLATVPLREIDPSTVSQIRR